MKTLILCLVMAFAFSTLHAQNADSIAYQLQRNKINGLLARRSQKFSQYSQSLAAKTGIFGWQTKKDIRRSGEILMDIAQTDEGIFRETKTLLDMKTFDQKQVVVKTEDLGDKNLSYMTTINKLRDEVTRLQQQQVTIENEARQKQTVHIIIIVLLIITSIFLFFRKTSATKA